MNDTIEEFIEFCYNRILGRESDFSGKEYYINKINDGASKYEIILSFLSSSEYMERLNSYNSQYVNPGHYYSPLPNISDVQSLYGQIDMKKMPIGININVDNQIDLLKSFSKYYRFLPFGDGIKKDNLRYFFNGDEWYSYGDAIVLYCMINYFMPKHFIEIGSGYSSLVTLDTCELLNINTEITLIEPFPSLVIKLLSEKDDPDKLILKKEVQQVNMSLFECLDNQDILFIDCSHVIKFASDVLFIFTEIFPRLKSGVIIHIHDIFWPFEYPIEWLHEGRAWNEAYFLKLLLINNKDYEILYFNDYMGQFHADLIKLYMPLAMKHWGCGIWLIKK